jgi:hypothetical protein
MKKLIAIVALATAVTAAPAFARPTGMNPDRQSEAYSKQQADTIVPSSNAYGPNY